MVERTITEEPARPQLAKAQPSPQVAQQASQAKVVKAQKAEPQALAAQALAAQDSGRFAVQVGAFSHDENARKVKDRLVQAGFRKASVTKAVRGGRELSVVSAGSYAEREQAEEALRNLKEEFPASFINTGA